MDMRTQPTLSSGDMSVLLFLRFVTFASSSAQRLHSTSFGGGQFTLNPMMQRNSARSLIVVCLIIFSPVTAISSSSSRREQQITKYGRDGAVHRLDQNPASNTNISFLPVAYLSAFNSIVNVIRPDASIMWQV
jgi:hypothetical protein